MSLKNKNKINPSYIYYMVLGSLYLIVKILFVSCGYLHLGAIFHGLIPAFITVLIGYLAHIEDLKSSGLLYHKAIVGAPILVFFLTPLYMLLKEGSNWLTNGRLEVLIIYEILALFQFKIALSRLRKLQEE